MSEYSIGGERRQIGDEVVGLDRLGLIGYIGTWHWNKSMWRFPVPLLAIDSAPKITHFDTATRFEGLLLSEMDDTHLIRDSWTGQVDIRILQEQGEGEVYLGNATTPSETTGFIFEHAVPFNPKLELAFVENPSEFDVLRTKDYDGIESHLIYADATILDGLGRVFKPER
jgi:hypothetical protein